MDYQWTGYPYFHSNRNSLLLTRCELVWLLGSIAINVSWQLCEDIECEQCYSYKWVLLILIFNIFNNNNNNNNDDNNNNNDNNDNNDDDNNNNNNNEQW